MSQFRLSRRTLLAGSAAFACAPAVAKTSPTPTGDSGVEKMLERMAEQLLVEYPENASALGLDTGQRAPLKSRLMDRSLAGVRAEQAAAAKRLAQLKAVNSAALSPAARTNLAVALYAHEVAVEGARFPYGDVAILNNFVSYRNSPYVVTQNVGAYYEVPDFLDTYHKIENRADAEAYLSRVAAFAASLDGENGRIRHDTALGVVPPAFLLDKAITQLQSLRARGFGEWGIVTSLALRTKAIPGNWSERAERLVHDSVAPAIDRQIAELTRQRSRARNIAGVWRQPDGEAYYAWALRASTTTRISPDEVHQLGLDLVSSLGAQMDTILRKQGLTQGSVGDRLTALGKDPRYLFPNTDPGRAELLEYVNGRVADMRTRLPRAFNTLVPGKLVVKHVPPEIEAGAPGGYAAAGSVDGSVPGYYYINLRDTADNPKWALPSLTYHEGIPGHIWQGEYSYKLPLIRTLLAFNAYSEGWALYAEQLADELGAYEGDDLGRLGYLQSIAFRACRLVVDTGLHAKRWSREDAIRWFVAANGSTESSVRSEVDRYCSWPGQACGYEMGHQQINRLRQKAQAELAARYDIKAFNDAVVLGGNVPLDVLGTNIDEYIGKARS
ncbi:MAG: DUF885 domain-containing protein [Sphingomicrobium sp.]